MQRVYNDRTNNAAEAWERRCEDLNAEDSDNADGVDESGDYKAGVMTSAPAQRRPIPTLNIGIDCAVQLSFQNIYYKN